MHKDMNGVLMMLQILILRITQGNDYCFARDCQDYKDRGFNKTGVYHVTPPGTYEGFDVYCDMDTDKGGWLVFQRRNNGSLDFYKSWHDYEFGFGDIFGEHWLGNFPIHWITFQGWYELRVDIEDWEENTKFAKYKVFRVEHAKDKYQLIVSGYSGTAGDSLSYHNRMAFSTSDQDNDNYSGSCAAKYEGAWWFNNCLSSNLNGAYLRGTHNDYALGVIWKDWTGIYYSLKKTEMKIRHV